MSILTIAAATAFLVLYCIVLVLWVKTMKLTESRVVKLVPGGEGSHQEGAQDLIPGDEDYQDPLADMSKGAQDLKKHIPSGERFATHEDMEKIRCHCWQIKHESELMDGNHDNWHEEDKIRKEIKQLLELFDTIHKARKLKH